MTPERLGLSVEHHETRVEEQTGDTELEDAPLNAAVDDRRRVTQRAVLHRDGNTADGVVHDLVPHQNVERVGTSVTVDFQRQDGGSRGQMVDTRCGLKDRSVDRRDAIRRRTARAELRKIGGRFGEFRERIVDGSQSGGNVFVRAGFDLFDLHDVGIVRLSRPGRQRNFGCISVRG